MKPAIADTSLAELVDRGRAALRAVEEADGRAARLEKSAADARRISDHRRLELGKILVEARGRWPARGPNAKGWGDYLGKLGVDDSTARRYMALAGWGEGVSLTCHDVSENSDLPTYRELGKDNRPRLTLVPPPADEAPAPDRNSWCTPKWIADAIGLVDLDPCWNERAHIRCQRKYSLERGQDGLELAAQVPRSWKVFVNPPYGPGPGVVMDWVRAYCETRFIFLVRLDPSTEWFDELHGHTRLILVPKRDRIAFEPPPGVEASSNPFPHGLLYRNAADATTDIRAHCHVWRPQ